MVKRQLAMLLAGIGILTVGISTPVSAEEYEPAGYHVYDVQEDDAIHKIIYQSEFLF